jgi:hypothetical protein
MDRGKSLACLACSTHHRPAQSKLPIPARLPFLFDLSHRQFPSPLTVRSPAMIPPQINAKYRHTYKHRTTSHEPFRQVGIYNCIKNTHQKGFVCGFDVCASFKPRFSHGERARRPRN